MIVCIKTNHDEERFITDAACVVVGRHVVRVCYEGGRPDEIFEHDRYKVSVVPS